ncbi:MAG: hypothetical protein QGG40_03050 [Myxococcota bacterium]|nr:hypothetical protein [Myxococcota bacterium]
MARTSCLALLLLLQTGVARATPSVEDLTRAIADYDAHAVLPLPELTREQVEDLRSGDVIRVLDDPGSGPKRATGLVLVPIERRRLWVAAQDLHYLQDERLTEYFLGWLPPAGKRWYGLIDLPRPFSDRHWVVDVHDNHALANSTGNQSWEHHWAGTENPQALSLSLARTGELGLDLDTYEDAVWMGSNRGAWLAIALDENHTVLGYHAQIELAGWVPPAGYLAWVRAGLDDLLLGVVERSAQVDSHYTQGHDPIVGANGETLPTW